MRKEYDFSKAVKNPYIRKKAKTPVTIRLDATTVDYFKSLSVCRIRHLSIPT